MFSTPYHHYIVVFKQINDYQLSITRANSTIFIKASVTIHYILDFQHPPFYYLFHIISKLQSWHIVC